MKMKNLLSPQPLRRRALALAFAAGLGGIAAAPATALNSDAFTTQARAALGYLFQLQQACKTSPVVFCPQFDPSIQGLPPLGTSRALRKLWRAL